MKIQTKRIEAVSNYMGRKCFVVAKVSEHGFYSISKQQAKRAEDKICARGCDFLRTVEDGVSIDVIGSNGYPCATIN